MPFWAMPDTSASAYSGFAGGFIVSRFGDNDARSRSKSSDTGKMSPSSTVPQIPMSLILSASTSNGSSSRMVKFANLPGAIEPTSSSNRKDWAASIVTARKASSTDRRCSGPATRPEKVVRFTPAHTRNNGSPGAIGTSEWKEIGMPLALIGPRGTMSSARSGPSPSSLYRSDSAVT